MIKELSSSSWAMSHSFYFVTYFYFTSTFLTTEKLLVNSVGWIFGWILFICYQRKLIDRFIIEFLCNISYECLTTLVIFNYLSSSNRLLPVHSVARSDNLCFSLFTSNILNIHLWRQSTKHECRKQNRNAERSRHWRSFMRKTNVHDHFQWNFSRFSNFAWVSFVTRG